MKNYLRLTSSRDLPTSPPICLPTPLPASLPAFSPAFLLRHAIILCSLTSLGALAGTTSPAGADEIALYAAGDIADCRDSSAAESPAAQTAALIAAQLARQPQARVLTMGDNTYPKGDPSEFAQCYAPTWGRFKEVTLPAPGNHDYYTAGGAGYFGYFGAQAGPAQRGYYRTQVGKWRLFSLNSYLQDPQQHAQQLAWLQQELASSPKGCTLAYWHHPLFSSGGHGNDPRMLDVWKVLQAAHVDVVLNGHDHDYERFAPQDSNGKADPQGIREFVVGTGGTPLSPALLRRANSEAINTRSHGVLKLTLHEHGYDWEFLPVAKDGFTDKGSASCH